MKRALQAILIAGEQGRADVMKLRQTGTVREGHRDYTEGPVLIGCHILQWLLMRTITKVRHTTLGEVTHEEYYAAGYETKSEMLMGLAEYYPDINWDSEVTTVKWEK